MRKSMTITLIAAVVGLAAAPGAWAVTTPIGPAQEFEQAPATSAEPAPAPAPEAPVAPPEDPATAPADPVPAAVDQEMDHGATDGFGSSPGATDGFGTSPRGGGLTAPVPLPPIPDPEPDPEPVPLAGNLQGKSFGQGGPATDGECAVRAASANAISAVQDGLIDAGADDGTIQGLGDAYQEVISDGLDRGCVFWSNGEDAE